MTVKEIRALTGLTQKQFAEKYHITFSSIRNWESGHRTCPDYVVELLEFKVRVDLKMDNITPEEFYQKMLKLSRNRDKERAHGKMDDLLCEALRQFGYSKGVEVFENADKWYS